METTTSSETRVVRGAICFQFLVIHSLWPWSSIYQAFFIQYDEQAEGAY